MDTTTILPTNGCITTTATATATATATTTMTTANSRSKPHKAAKAPLSSKLKCVRKKRNAGKKDKQSKIHTAQGLRDRRMRLSVHTARKFFDLNDMLGFDKASKTIEWLFSKSHEAIEEVTETLQSQAAAQTVTSETETDLSMMEIASAADQKDENLNPLGDQIDEDSSRKPPENMIKNHGKMKADHHRDDFHPSLQETFDDHNMKETESSCYPLEFSNTYHFLQHLHLDNNNTVKYTDNTYMGNITSISSTTHSIFDYTKTTITETPSCWLNSRNPFLGLIGGWSSETSRMESNNRIVQNMATLSGNMSTNFMDFHSENRGQ